MIWLVVPDRPAIEMRSGRCSHANQFYRALLRFFSLFFFCFVFVGCTARFRYVAVIKTPLNTEMVRTASGEPKSSPSAKVTLGQIISIDKTGSPIRTTTLSLAKIPVTVKPAENVRSVVSDIADSELINLLGLANRNSCWPEKKHLSEQYPQAEQDDPVEITFSDVEDVRLDPRATSEYLRLARINSDRETAFYLTVEELRSQQVSIDLSERRFYKIWSDINPDCAADRREYKPASLETSAQIRSSPGVSATYINNRWRLSKELPVKRNVAEGVAKLKPRPKSGPTAVITSPAQTAVALGWIESIPETTFHFGASDGEKITQEQARLFLENLTRDARLGSKASFPLKEGYGVLTQMEVLEGRNSVNPAKDKLLTDTFPWRRWWCRFINCVINTTREFVLVIGHKPQTEPDGPIPSGEQIQRQSQLLRPDENSNTQTIVNPECHAFVYIYDHHWDGLYQSITLGQQGQLAYEHLVGAGLSKFKDCKLQ